MDAPRLGVVTVTYNSANEIAPFLTSITQATSEKTDVIVVDNASKDRDPIRTASAAHQARYIQLDENRGYGGGVNAGTALLVDSCDAVLISNPDVLLGPGSLDALVTTLRENPDIGAVGPRILTEDGETYPSARELPSLAGGVGHALFSRIWPSNPWTQRYHNEKIDTRQEASVGWLSGACLLVRRQAFEDIKGFDESFFMYFEDVDLGRRLRAKGWQNYYLPSATVVHMGARSTSQDSDRMLAAHHSSAYLFLSRRYPHWYQRPLRDLLRLGLWFRLRLSLLRS